MVTCIKAHKESILDFSITDFWCLLLIFFFFLRFGMVLWILHIS